MTISNTASFCTYTGNGALQIYPVADGSQGIYFADASELVVTLRSGETITPQSVGTHYTVSGAGSDAGSVTFLTAPANGVEIRIERRTPLTQTVAFSAGQSYSPAVVMAALDKITRALQDVSRGSSGDGGSSTYNADPLTKNAAGTAWDGEGLPVKSAGNAIDSSDLVALGQVNTLIASLAGGGPGNVLGIASSVDNTLVRFDQTTGKVIQGSGIVVDDSNGITLPANINQTGAITPTQITADQNDYAPTGHATAAILRLATDATRTVTGLAGGVSGAIKVIRNVGAQSLVLAHESASSSAANRFKISADITVQAGKSIELIYDGTESRWYRRNSDVAAGVTTFNGRSGAVVPASGDYTIDQITSLRGTLEAARFFTFF